MKQRQFFWLIHSTPQGIPDPRGVDYHFVRVGDSTMHVVAQMHDGGRFPETDCAVADTLSALSNIGLSASAVTIERGEGTSATGTDEQKLAAELIRLGFADVMVLPADPPKGFIMNSAMGALFDPSYFATYLAASAHSVVAFNYPSIAPISQPSTPTVRKGESMTAVLGTPDGSQQRFYYVEGDHIMHKWYVSADGKMYGPQDITFSVTPAAQPIAGSLSATNVFGVAGDIEQIVLFYQATDGNYYELWMTVADDKWHGPARVN